MADKKRQPSAQVTLILGKTLRTKKMKFINGRPKTVVGEANISHFETESRFVVRRDKEIREETVASRKARQMKPKATKKPTAK